VKDAELESRYPDRSGSSKSGNKSGEGSPSNTVMAVL
jgi:hypothetical protein